MSIRSAMPRFASGSLLLLVTFGIGCSTDEVAKPPPDVCVNEPKAGAWQPLIEWPDVGLTGNDHLVEPKPPPYDDIFAHHAYLTAVHAAHLPSGEFMLFHGEGDVRVWPIGAPQTDIRWHPVPFTVPPNLCSYDAEAVMGPGANCYASIFCSGHVVLPNGKLFVAGGNVTGSPNGGGLVDMFMFDATEADPNLPMFGWEKSANSMAVDRWYPTLTVIPGANPQLDGLGRVLISSGASRVPGGQNIFELYDPATDQVSQLTIEGVSPFHNDNSIPLYPFMFLLPNGDIFYAGGEGTAYPHGRVLIPDYNNNGTWLWDPRVFLSSMNGGSAVMYAPGKIMKSGGVIIEQNLDGLAHAQTETIDLSGFSSGDYLNAPNFTPRQSMANARHFHTLTLLPDGRVLATNGNTRADDRSGDHSANECNCPQGSTCAGSPIASQACTDLNLDGVPDDPATAANGCPAVPSRCSGTASCPMRPGTECLDVDGVMGLDHASCGAPCSSDSECPPGSTCGAVTGHCEMPCPEDGSETCGAVVHCAPGMTSCDPANNACFATHTAEIWDPDCFTWTDLGVQDRPRMYHSTALLQPDGNVIAMGGGHIRGGQVDQWNAQTFVPEYGGAGVANAPQIQVIGPTDIDDYGHPSLPWNGDAQVMVTNGGGTVYRLALCAGICPAVASGIDLATRAA